MRACRPSSNRRGRRRACALRLASSIGLGMTTCPIQRALVRRERLRRYGRSVLAVAGLAKPSLRAGGFSEISGVLRGRTTLYHRRSSTRGANCTATIYKGRCAMRAARSQRIVRAARRPIRRVCRRLNVLSRTRRPCDPHPRIEATVRCGTRSSVPSGVLVLLDSRWIPPTRPALSGPCSSVVRRSARGRPSGAELAIRRSGGPRSGVRFCDSPTCRS